jgi:ATP-dependent Clp protease adaptor protein ClpS
MEDNKTHQVVIYNDDVNSYDYVTACLIKLCRHEPIQAEQCAVVANNVGKCAVKSGNYLDMFELKTTFDDLDINSEIEEYASGMY